MNEYISNNFEDTINIAKELALTLKPNDIVAYSGSMGMGKTTFTRGIILGLGGEDIVSSPTFAIMNEYDTPVCKVYHFDMYRIETWDDLYSTAFFDFLDTGVIMLIEWSENIVSALPQNIIMVELCSAADENSRIIKIDRR